MSFFHLNHVLQTPVILETVSMDAVSRSPSHGTSYMYNLRQFPPK